MVRSIPARRASVVFAIAVAAVAALTATGSASARGLAASQPAIVGGLPAAAGTWPWLAFVEYNEAGDAESCSGTVVAPNLVLTAAHCAEDMLTGATDAAAGFTVVTGSVDYGDGAGRQLSAVTDVIVHATTVEMSQSAGINILGDAALLELATPTTAPPIALADGSDAASLQPGTDVEAAGWGLTSATASTIPTTLQAARSVIQNPTYCLQENPQFSAEAQLCAVDAPAYTTSICDGDSGGPLVAQTPAGTWIEVGISSASENTCDPALPDIFTRADYVEPWVQSWIADLAPAASTVASATVAAAPDTPQAGSYGGSSSQANGHVDLTESSGGIVRLTLEYQLRCPHGRRGPFGSTLHWSAGSPLTLITAGDRWAFSTSGTAANGWRFAVDGSFTTPTTATGTLSVTTRNGLCRTGPVAWTAAR